MKRPIHIVERIAKANRGKKRSVQFCENQSRRLKGVRRPHMYEKRYGDRNNHWKGDRVGYSGIHKWIKKTLGNQTQCYLCGVIGLKGVDGRSMINWANISGEYRRDITDWTLLCTKCHKAYDLGKIQLL